MVYLHISEEGVSGGVKMGTEKVLLRGRLGMFIAGEEYGYTVVRSRV